MGIWEEGHRDEVPFSLPHVKGVHQQHDVWLDVDVNSLAEVVFVRLLHCKVLLFPFFPYLPL